MNAVQCKMARAALGLTVRQLAEMAKVSHDTIVRLEAGEVLKLKTVKAIEGALEAAGVIFIPADSEGEGVRLRRASM